jgi:hypothetical protein
MDDKFDFEKISLGSLRFLKYFAKRFQVYSDKDIFYKLPYFLKNSWHVDSKFGFIKFLEEYFKRNFFYNFSNNVKESNKFPFLQSNFKLYFTTMVSFFDKFIGIRNLILSSDRSFFFKFLIPFNTTDFIVI